MFSYENDETCRVGAPFSFPNRYVFTVFAKTVTHLKWGLALAAALENGLASAAD